MLIIFAIDHQGQRAEIGDLLRAALTSVLCNTRHTPVVLSPSFDADFAAYLREQHVRAITIDSPMRAAVESANLRSGYPLQAIGNYLRYEACNAFADEPAVLYADCDTIFLRDFDDLAAPALIAAAPEDELDSWARRNSGVLLLNPRAFAAALPGFYAFAQANIVRLLPGFDQAALNEYFSGQIAPLDPIFNWRPYWGPNDDARILHIHGVKRSVVLGMFRGKYTLAASKKRQVTELCVNTLAQLPGFAATLDARIIAASQELGALIGHAEDARRLLAAPVLGHFELVEKCVAALESTRARQSLDAVRLAQAAAMHSTLHLTHGTGTDRLLRMVFDCGLPHFILGSLVDTDGELVADVHTSLNNNVDLVATEDAHTAICVRQDDNLLVDIVFGNASRVLPDKLRVVMVTAAVCRVTLYLAEAEGAFSEDRSVSLVVCPGRTSTIRADTLTLVDTQPHVVPSAWPKHDRAGSSAP
jgi:hypothetical protein